MPLNNKPQWYKDLYASVHPDPLARAKVPIIEIGKPNDAEYQILVESDVVARFVAENWKSQGEQLVPDNKFAEAKMNLFIGQFICWTTYFLDNLFHYSGHFVLDEKAVDKP